MQPRSLIVLGLPVLASALAIAPRQEIPSGDAAPTFPADDQCCFQLASVDQTVLEDNIGELRLGGVFQEGGFCLAPGGSGTLNDARGLNCFLRGPEFQFQCYQGARGFSVFNLTRGLDGKTYLAVNGSIEFLACPAGGSVPPPAPSDADPTQVVSYNIFSPDTSLRSDTCKPVVLALKNPTALCAGIVEAAVGAGAGGSSPAEPAETSSPAGPAASLPPTATSATSTARVVTPTAYPSGAGRTCDVAASAPSVAPNLITVESLTAKTNAFQVSPDFSASIVAGINATRFTFQLPASNFYSSPDATCALQLRLPPLESLPAGYPPYSAKSSSSTELPIQVELVEDTEARWGITWSDISPKRVTVGSASPQILGTFRCGGHDPTVKADRIMTWSVNALLGSSLTFTQAGGSNGFKDGVGLFVVAC